MLVHVNLEIEHAEELVALGKFFGQFAGTVHSASVADPAPEPIRRPAPAPQKAVAKPVEVEQRNTVEGEKPVEQDEGVEEVTKDVVAKELRTFIAKAGKDGPKQALAVLKQFGASKFDDLKAEDYSKFLTALNAA